MIVDEDDLPAGVGDTAAGDDTPQNATGDTLDVDFGADGGRIALTTTGTGTVINGVTYSYTLSTTSVANDTLTVNDGTNDVLRITITDVATGAYTVALLARLERTPAHGTPGTEDDIATSPSRTRRSMVTTTPPPVRSRCGSTTTFHRRTTTARLR